MPAIHLGEVMRAGEIMPPTPAAVPSATPMGVIDHLQARGYIAYHPRLAQEFGFKSAIVLGLSLYWMRKSLIERPRGQGWFYMTGPQWTASTALGRREIETVRADLVERGILEEKLEGSPPTKHYRIKLSAMAKCLGESAPSASLDLAQGWFKYSIAYYKPLADLTGSPASGLYLSYLLHQLRNNLLATLPTATIEIDQHKLNADLCLGPWVQRQAKDRLKQAGLVSELKPGKARVNWAAIMSCLQGQSIEPLPQPRLKSTRTAQPAAIQDTPVKSEATPPSMGLSAQRGLDLAKGKQTSKTELSEIKPLDRGDLLLNWISHRNVGNRHIKPAAIQQQEAAQAPETQEAQASACGQVPRKLDENAKLG